MEQFCVEIKKMEDDIIDMKTIFENYVKITSNFEQNTKLQEMLTNKNYLNDYNDKMSILLYQRWTQKKRIFVIITEYVTVVHFLYLFYCLKEKNPMCRCQLIDSNVFVFECNEIEFLDINFENYKDFCIKLSNYIKRINQIAMCPKIKYTEFCQNGIHTFYDLINEETMLDEVNYYFNVGC